MGQTMTKEEGIWPSRGLAEEVVAKVGLGADLGRRYPPPDPDNPGPMQLFLRAGLPKSDGHYVARDGKKRRW